MKNDRVELIREGNKLMNQGKISAAAKIFTVIKYNSGLEKIGDMLLDKNQPYAALKYYQLAKNERKVDMVAELIGETMKIYLLQDKYENISDK